MEETKKNSEEKQVIRGLEGVVAAETDISFVDGEQGNLYYKGYNIHDLADNNAVYGEIVYLIMKGKLPNEAELLDFRSQMIGEMILPSEVLELLRKFPDSSHPMDALRTGVSALAMYDPDGPENSYEANYRKGMRLIAQVPALVANFFRIRKGLDIIAPHPELSLSGNILYMFHGVEPSETHLRAMDLLLMLQIDHGLNASTFAVRVTASTHSDLHSAITSAIGTLKGPLHGGANERVMLMLKEINNVSEVEEYINSMLAQGQKVMGFGHRVYKKEDPRTRHLRKVSEELCSTISDKNFYEISHHIETVVMQAKGIYPNVDFYSATVQHGLGIPEEFYTTIFAVARMSGWVAHCLEQYANNKLIRPTSKYIGEYNKKFFPIGERSRLEHGSA